METHSNISYDNSFDYTVESIKANDINEVLQTFSKENSTQNNLLKLAEILMVLQPLIGKKNFLVFRHNKYVNVPIENIAFFYIKYESPMIMCFDKQEYFVNYSLEQIQNLLPEKQFYRLNRQYLINFTAVKEVEHYFARKLLVNAVIPTKDKLIVPRLKVSEFLHWLDNR